MEKHRRPPIPRPSTAIPQVPPDIRPPGHGHVRGCRRTGRRPPCIAVIPNPHPPAPRFGGLHGARGRGAGGASGRGHADVRESGAIRGTDLEARECQRAGGRGSWWPRGCPGAGGGCPQGHTQVIAAEGGGSWVYAAGSSPLHGPQTSVWGGTVARSAYPTDNPTSMHA